MRNGYKSAAAGDIAGKYAGSVIGNDVENNILSGTSDGTPSASLDGMIKEISDLQVTMGKVGINNPLMAKVYRMTDRVGLTSPQSRLKDLCYDLEKKSSRLERTIKLHNDSLDKIARKVDDTKSKRRDANLIMEKYKAFEREFATQEAKMLDDKSRAKEDRDKLDPGSNDRIRYTDTMTNINNEVEKLKEDAQTVRTKIDRSAMAVIKYNRRAKFYDNERQMRKCVVNALEQVNNNLILKVDEIKVMVDNNSGSLMGTFKDLKDAQAAYEKVTRSLGEIPEEINKALTTLVTGMPVEHPDMTRLEERTNELKRVDDQSMSAMQRQAEEIMRKEAA
jgi:hypothetical protein